MRERITIRDFAGIKSVDLDLRRINILIGPQATGKSICAKMLYFFKGFTSQLFTSLENQDEESKRGFDLSILRKFEEYFPPQSWPDSPFAARYEIGDLFVEVSRAEDKKKIRLSYSEEFTRQRKLAQQNLGNVIEAMHGEEKDYDRRRAIYRARQDFYKSIDARVGEVATFNQLFIPAGRSFFANLQSSIFSFLSGNKAIDPFLIEFGSVYESIKEYPEHFIHQAVDDLELEKKLDSLVAKILCGKHVRERGRDYLVLPDGRQTAIANSSSGQQEMLPLAVVLRVFPFVRFSGWGHSIYIEEPEAHLFPTAQRHIVELMAAVFTSARLPLQFIITTHSPYILTAFNNLLEAGRLNSTLTKAKVKRLREIVPPEQMLKAEEFRAYSLNEGKAQSICCDETGLIATNVIDDVSEALSVQFDSLLEIEE
ncbi:MAG: ATP-binding protein [Armatimonadota bacterium]|nr:ATP-binding protein [Armatimonadota bacterium]